MRNPLVISTRVLATISFAQATCGGDGDGSDGDSWSPTKVVQETRADAAAAKLKAMIKVTATVIRQGVAMEIPLKDLVPGDIR